MKNIGVFFGSRNTEHDISIITAQLIISGLKGLGYNVIPIYISQKGKWMLGDELASLKTFTENEKVFLKNNKFSQYFLDLENSVGKIVFQKKDLFAKSIEIDLAFPAFHGAFGEDGTIQGLFEMFNIPYVGCDVSSSAIAMDKALTKNMFKANLIPTTKFIEFYKHDWLQKKDEIINKIKNLEWPVFVKPVHGGSSIGISKIKDHDLKDLENKIDVALYYDNKALVEVGVANLMDVTCCVIGNDDLEASWLQESVFSSDLFDFEEKYLKDGGSQLGKSESGLVVPARLDAGTTKKIQKMAKEVYKTLGCSGIARVDFLYNKLTKELFANEVNPLPGTVYHHLWKASGLELEPLLEKLIKYAEQKHNRKKELTHVFESSFLTSLKSSKLGSAKLGNK